MLDFETYSEVSLRDVGLDVYFTHPSTEVLMLAWADISSEPPLADNVRQWVPAEGEPMPADLRCLLEDDSVLLEAWNAPFERGILAHQLGFDIPIHRWRDTMVRALYAGLLGSLDKAAQVLGVEEGKDAHGKRLLNRFSKPYRGKRCGPVDAPPGMWESLKAYNRQDVVAQIHVFNALREVAIPGRVWEEWFLDQQINLRGIPMNRRRVVNCKRLYEEQSARLMDMLRDLTGLANPGSGKQFLPWAQERGYPFDSLGAAFVRRALGMDRVSQEAKDVLELRMRALQRSSAKYAALLSALSDDDHLRHGFQFLGASRTGRWAGRRFQPHNLPRPPGALLSCYDSFARFLEEATLSTLSLAADPMDALKGMIRASAEAPDGFLFADADLSAIENRVLGWVAGEEKILDAARAGRDLYIDFASYMFGASYDQLFAEYKAGDKTKRTLAKPATLGCGFMLSAGQVETDPVTGVETATGLMAYARDIGVDLPQEMADLSVRVFRQTYSRVVKFWYDMQDAVVGTAYDGRPRRCRMFMVDRTPKFLRIHLPSGRALHYYRPRVRYEPTPWGEERLKFFYEGRRPNGSWGEVGTHPGKITENIVQALARDVLVFGLRNAVEAGLDVCMHVHDQIVALVPERQAEEQLDLLRRCMARQIPWAPDLPLKAGGFLSRVFKKD